MTKRPIALGLAAAASVVLAAYLYWGEPFALYACANQVVRTVPNPNGSARAVLFERDCGATTDFSSQVSLLPGGAELPNERGNAFVAEDNKGAAKTAPWGGPMVALKWLSSRQLEIRYSRRARVFVAAQSIDGIEIRYVPE